MDTDKQKLRDLMKRFRHGMLVTHGSGQGGSTHARPMAVANVDGSNGDFGVWFLTDRSSPKVLEIEAHPEVQLILQDASAFVAMTGDATVVKDRAKLDQLWNVAYEAWFPKGKDDPSLVLIHMRAREAEYWDQTGGKKLAYFAQALKAVITGKRPNTDDQHGKARM